MESGAHSPGKAHGERGRWQRGQSETKDDGEVAATAGSHVAAGQCYKWFPDALDAPGWIRQGEGER